jgi:hypothetical protein
MADNLYRPAPPQESENQDVTTQGVQVLEYLEKLKNLTSTFDMQEEGQAVSRSEVVYRSHSVDVLHDFRNMIIDVFMGYIIYQTHFLSSPPLTATQRNKKFCEAKATAESASSDVAATPSQMSADLVKQKAESTKQLQTIQVRHNFQPLIFFLLAGVRGLFIASMDYCTASTSDSMSFIEAMLVITQHSKTHHTPEEPIWKNLLAYLVELFRPSFQSPDKIIPLAQAPSCIKLAEAITMDFLNHWKDKQPSSPFLIPHSATIHPVTDS